MSEWEQLRDKMAHLIEDEYKKDSSLLDLINAWYRVRVVGDKLLDKTRELDAYLSVEQVLAKRWEKFIELMGDDSYTELDPEEYVSQLDDREKKLETLHTKLRELLEYNYMNGCKADIENLLEQTSIDSAELRRTE